MYHEDISPIGDIVPETLKWKKQKAKPSKLFTETPIEIRFNEVDSLRIVWHGHYLKYFEDGREDFGKKHGIGYLDVYEQGYSIPVVQSFCQHRSPIKYGMQPVVKTQLIDTKAAKIIYQYEIFNPENGTVLALGETWQVFMDKDGELMLSPPDFFREWKEKWL